MYIVLLIGGLAALFWFFSWLEIRVYQRGVKKHGDAYRSPYDVIKVGYFIMFIYFAALSLEFADGDGAGDYYDPCGGSMRC